MDSKLQLDLHLRANFTSPRQVNVQFFFQGKEYKGDTVSLNDYLSIFSEWLIGRKTGLASQSHWHRLAIAAGARGMRVFPSACPPPRPPSHPAITPTQECSLKSHTKVSHTYIIECSYCE